MSKLLMRAKKYKNEGFNKFFIEGIAKHSLDKFPQEIHQRISDGMKHMNKDLDFKYLGFRYLTPKEDFESQITRDTVDISKSTLYRLGFTFSLNGETFERLLDVPYVDDGGVLSLSDAKYAVVPVLTEYVVSSNGVDVFSRLNKDKLIYRKFSKNIIVNGDKTIIDVIVSKLYKFSKTNINDRIPISIMIMNGFGFKETFKRLFNAEPILILDDKGIENYDLEKYVVYESLGLRPGNLKDNSYLPHRVKILVRSEENSSKIMDFIGSLIYSMDLINIMARKIPDVVNSGDLENEKRLWKVILGKLIFKNKYTIDKIIENTDEYLEVVKSYIDHDIKTQLAEIDIHVNNFYELLSYIVLNFDELTANADNNSSSLDKRYININYYIGHEIMTGINKALYGINKESYKINAKKSMTIDDLQGHFNKHFSTRKIFRLINDGVNIALSPVDSSSDNYLFKTMSMLEDQNRGDGVVRSKNNVFPHNTRTVHAEDVVMGSISSIMKKAPTYRLKINPNANIVKEKMKIIPTKEDREFIEACDKLLSGKTNDDTLINDDINAIEEIDID